MHPTAPIQVRKPHGFSLVELLIVIVILGILAAVVLPHFTNSTQDAKAAILERDLKLLSTQIQLYAAHHFDRLPGAGSTDPQDFKDALLLSSDADGTTGPPGSKQFGPYLMGEFPPNPYNGGRGVKIAADVDAVAPNPAETNGNGLLIGWIYSPDSGRIKSNAP